MSAKSHLRFDEIENVLSSLDLLALVGKLVRTKPSYWKWVIIAAHDALQGAMVCVLGGTSGVVGEQEAPKTVLVLVPSLTLLKQTLFEWSEQTSWGKQFSYLCVCSDPTVCWKVCRYQSC